MVRRRIGHEVERLDRPARDQLAVVGEDGRPGAQQLAGDLGHLLGGRGARIAHGRKLERGGVGADAAQRAVGAKVPTTHAAAAHQTD